VLPAPGTGAKSKRRAGTGKRLVWRKPDEDKSNAERRGGVTSTEEPRIGPRSRSQRVLRPSKGRTVSHADRKKKKKNDELAVPDGGHENGFKKGENYGGRPPTLRDLAERLN